MTKQNLATVTNELITAYGNTAKNVISAYAVGNKRAVGFVDHSWAIAVKKAGSRLNADFRGNAISSQKKITARYAKGVTTTTVNANNVVDKAVELAGKSVVQVAANAGRFEKSTGVTALRTLAVASLPAAKVVGKVAAKLEVQSGLLAKKIAGSAVKVKATAVKRAVAKKAAAVAKPTTKAVRKTAPKVAA